MYLGQSALNFPGNLLKVRDGLTALEVHRGRSLTDNANWAQLDDARETALVMQPSTPLQLANS